MQRTNTFFAIVQSVIAPQPPVQATDRRPVRRGSPGTRDAPSPSTPPSLVTDSRATSRLLLVLIAASLVATSAIGYLLLRASEETRSLVAATRDARLAHEALLDQQIGVRGFLLAGDTRYLEPHDAGRAVISDLHRSVATELAGDPELILLLIDAELAADRWMEQSAPVGVDQTLLTGTELRSFTEQGKVLFDRYRTAHERLVARVAAKRDAVVIREHRLVLGGFALQLFLLGATAWYGVRHRERLSRQVIGPLAELEAVVDRLRHGDLDARLGPSRYAELHNAGAGLAELAEELRAERRRADDRAAALTERADRLRALLRTSREISATTDVDVIADVVERAARRLSGWSTAHVHLRLDGRVSQSDDLQEVEATGIPLVRSDRIVVPMVVGGRVLGLLEAVDDETDLSSTGGGAPSDELVEVLSMLANQAAAALDAATLNATLAEESRIDPLTTLRNRRSLDEDLATMLDRNDREGSPLCVVVIDIDRFKTVNDEHGHAVGDLVLARVAEATKSSLRGDDTAYRLGGEEFVVLLPKTSIPEASEVAERIRRAVAREEPAGLAITVSAGVAARRSGERADELIARADASLYRAKAEGRDRVVVDASMTVVSSA